MQMHIHADALELYLMNRIDGHAAEAIEEHLLICGTCQDHAAEAELELEMLRRLLHTSVPERISNVARATA